jgi:hypothetical protein
MGDVTKALKNAAQDAEAKLKTTEDHAEGKPSSETWNKIKIKERDAESGNQSITNKLAKRNKRDHSYTRAADLRKSHFRIIQREIMAGR